MDDADAIDAAGLAADLAGTGLGPVEWRTEVTSTNDELAAAARAGAGEGRVLGADHQVEGRGRRGRAWVDRPGAGLAVSVLVRPRRDDHLSAASPIIAGVATAEAIGDHARLAWPNDVLVDGRKVAGVLVEAGSSGGGVEWVVIGIGVNVRGVPTVPDARWPPGSIDGSGSAPRRGVLVADVLTRLWERIAECRRVGLGPVLAAWERRDALRGRQVQVRVGADTVSGTAAGVDGEGRLLLHGPGAVIALASAEVVRVES